MRGGFKSAQFDKDVLSQFVNELKSSGVEFEASWTRGNKPVDPQSGDANMLTLKYKGKLFFRQFNRQGSASPGIIEQSRRSAVLSALKKYGFYTQPEYGLGIVLVVVFLLLQATIVLPAAADRSEVLVYVVVALNVLLLLGILLLNQAASKPKGAGSSKLAMVFTGIGFVLLSPLSLINIVLLKAIGYKALYNQVMQGETP